MKENVKNSITLRKNFFTQYYIVPESVKPEIEAFIVELEMIGEQCEDAAAFEAEFAQKNMQEKMNGIILKCEPKPFEMSDSEKTYAKQTAKEIFEEDKGRIIKEAAIDVAESAALTVESELITEKNKILSEAGVLDDYTRATNLIDDVGRLGKFFKKKNKKKNK